MTNTKDELISGAELARRLKISQAYITKQKKEGNLNKCTYGKKYYYRKCSLALGKDPENPHISDNSESQKKPDNKSDENWTVTTGKKEIKAAIEKKYKSKKNKPTLPGDNDNEDEAKDFLTQILDTINNKTNTLNKAELNGLKLKAGILKEYFQAKNEEIKNKKLEDNLFEREQILNILGFAVNMIRNALVNLPNNYAVNLQGLSQSEIKNYVEEDINKILTDFQQTGEQFNNE